MKGLVKNSQKAESYQPQWTFKAGECNSWKIVTIITSKMRTLVWMYRCIIMIQHLRNSNKNPPNKESLNVSRNIPIKEPDHICPNVSYQVKTSDYYNCKIEKIPMGNISSWLAMPGEWEYRLFSFLSTTDFYGNAMVIKMSYLVE